MAKRKKSSNTLGSWSFLIGLILAVLLGLGLGGAYERVLVWVLFLLGVLVGLLNVSSKETGTFMTSGTVLTLVSFLGVSLGVFTSVPILQNILVGILILFVPATIVVALKSVVELARD